MKKTLLLSVFALISSFAFSQVKIGLNFSPALAFSRLSLEKEDKLHTYDAKGVGVRFIAGPEISFYMGENAAFTTGAWYALKRAAFNMTTDSTNLKSANSGVYNLQYIQLPATFKLFTNEIATDMKLYFQLGGTFDIKLAEKRVGAKVNEVSAFRPLDASILFGAGIEMQMGESTYFLIGLRYTRGLMNTLKSNVTDDKVTIKNSLVSLDLGIRF